MTLRFIFSNVVYKAVSQVYIDFKYINFKFFKLMKKYLYKLISIRPGLLILIAYLSLILIGSLALMLPICQKRPVAFIDLFFTSASAVCVTGLTTVGTAEAWTFWGHLTIMTLIQLGGLGIMTIATAIFISAGRRIPSGERLFFQDTMTTGKFKDLAYLLKSIFLFTLTIEFIGALFLTIGFMGRQDLLTSVWTAVFHSISAFNNAGFSLFTNSLADYGDSALISVTIMLLIILGGLGYFVLLELYEYRIKSSARKLTIHSRAVLLTSAGLILFGAAAIYGAGNIGVLDAFFQSVTARTAGFNTVDLKRLPNASILILTILMFIGSSPGSTGGGIKTTSFLMLIALGISRLRGNIRVSIFRRTVPISDVIKSVAVFALGIFVVTSVTSGLIIFQSGLPSTDPAVFRDAAFEAVSAFATVGLSLGITPHLTVYSKIALIIAMLIGKVGILTIAYSLAAPKKRNEIIYAEESIMVG
jgi:trk system potassium uptake protein TrkH